MKFVLIGAIAWFALLLYPLDQNGADAILSILSCGSEDRKFKKFIKAYNRFCSENEKASVCSKDMQTVIKKLKKNDQPELLISWSQEQANSKEDANAMSKAPIRAIKAYVSKMLAHFIKSLMNNQVFEYYEIPFETQWKLFCELIKQKNDAERQKKFNKLSYTIYGEIQFTFMNDNTYETFFNKAAGNSVISSELFLICYHLKNGEKIITEAIIKNAVLTYLRGMKSFVMSCLDDNYKALFEIIADYDGITFSLYANKTGGENKNLYTPSDIKKLFVDFAKSLYESLKKPNFDPNPKQQVIIREYERIVPPAAN